jgi:hypothetical protein
MRLRKPGKKPALGSSAKNSDQHLPAGLPTWPRADLTPPELILGWLRDCGRAVLASGHVTEVDRPVVEQAVQQLYSAEAELLTLLGQVSLHSRKPTLARRLFELTALIAGAAYVVGAHYAMTDTARVFFEKSRALQARLSRATGEKERQITGAIKAELEAIGGTIPSGHPHKDAEAIQDGVNKRLNALGLKAISVQQLYRRLRRS